MEDQKLKFAIEVLEKYLSDGPKIYSDVNQYCYEKGITKTILRTARRELKVKTINTGVTWIWYLPNKAGVFQCGNRN